MWRGALSQPGPSWLVMIYDRSGAAGVGGRREGWRETYWDLFLFLPSDFPVEFPLAEPNQKLREKNIL